MFPALNHNKTQKPRMSILMPALVQINDTNMQNTHNTIAFMQIDCEVLDTSLIYLKSSNIPLNYVKILSEDYDLMSTTKSTNSNT
jgi:cyclic AMP-dependent transcription factor ATF-6 alpha